MAADPTAQLNSCWVAWSGGGLHRVVELQLRDAISKVVLRYYSAAMQVSDHSRDCENLNPSKI